MQLQITVLRALGMQPAPSAETQLTLYSLAHTSSTELIRLAVQLEWQKERVLQLDIILLKCVIFEKLQAKESLLFFTAGIF